MNFIESLLHMSPDNGTGSTEVAIVVAILAGLLLARAAILWAKSCDESCLLA